MIANNVGDTKERPVTLYPEPPSPTVSHNPAATFATSTTEVIYGEMYIVSFDLDGDQYLTVKYVSKSEKEGCIRLVSYNPHHDPMDLPLKCIHTMAIVKFSIRKNMMM